MSDDAQTTSGADEPFDASARELCPDGNCTGVLDAAGVCKACGLQGAPPAPNAVRAVADAAADDDVARALAGDDPSADDARAAADDSDGEFAARQLCPDGNCVGLIGDAGVCKICGRPAAS